MNSSAYIKPLLIVIISAIHINKAYSQNVSDGLKLVSPGTDNVYFSYNNKPLLSFGGMSDFIFYASEDAYDYKKWANWQAAHGMNHCRAYLPGSWIHIEKFTEENGGSVDNVLFPFEETYTGSRKFDLTKFNEAYWKRFREQCKYLESKGIIIDLLMWNGWQLWTPYRKEFNWDGHFFNPINNINPCTDHLATESVYANRLKFYHSIADDEKELFEIQKRYFEKIIEMTYDLGNIYYELVHELGMNYSDWPKTSKWIEEIALSVRAKWDSLNPDKPIILGTDAGHLKGFPFNQSGGFPEPGSEIDWVFTRPYFDMLNYGDCNHTANAREWRLKYKKPYVPQESTDDIAQAWSYYNPAMRNHIRKYVWKMMMSKCQQMDVYMKNINSYFLNSEKAAGYSHNYNPTNKNDFEKDALLLRQFFDSIIDFGALKFKGHFFISPLGHNLVLSSDKEIICYVSSPTGMENVAYKYASQGGAQIRLADLPFPDGKYKVNFFDPKHGFLQSKDVWIRDGDSMFATPPFIDDLSFQILK